MTERRVHLRALAAADIDQALAHLQTHAGATVGLDFVDALENGIDRITRLPNAGSLRFAFELGIPELRALPLRRFPYLIFSIPLEDLIDVWRVLHTRRDIPGTIAAE